MDHFEKQRQSDCDCSVITSEQKFKNLKLGRDHMIKESKGYQTNKHTLIKLTERS